MTTAYGRAWVIKRLQSCPDMPTLRSKWDDIAIPYQREPEVQQARDAMKRRLTNDRNLRNDQPGKTRYGSQLD